MPTAAANNHLQVGLLLFPDLDQLDFTGPFEVLSRMPDSTLHLLWKTVSPVRDMMGLVLQPTMALMQCAAWLAFQSWRTANYSERFASSISSRWRFPTTA